MRQPVIHISEILAWADAFHKRVGRWPRRDDGKIPGKLGMTWTAVDQALCKGNRGLRPGSSLAKLLLEHRGRRHKTRPPKLTIRQIVAWADVHKTRTGKWPTTDSGPIHNAPGETWLAVDQALRNGGRGLRRNQSLARLLAQKRGVPNYQDRPPLSRKQVLAWADAHRKRTGKWPQRNTGEIPGSSGETWLGIQEALLQGRRGLENGSLAQFLSKYRGVRNCKAVPQLKAGRILKWAKAFNRRTGRWPNYLSGAIPEAPGETWGAVNAALYLGTRGLPGGSSLFQVLGRLRQGRTTIS